MDEVPGMKLEEDHYRGLKAHMSGLRMHDHICMAYTDREQQVTAIAYYIKVRAGTGRKVPVRFRYINIRIRPEGPE